jgi:hypothetical protein
METRSQQLLLAVALVWSWGLDGCALHPGHTIAPYGSDVQEACKLEVRAADTCRQRRGGAVPPYSFTTDGCSYWPDGTWKECCIEHDIAYWCGGGFSDRLEADRKLQDCVEKTGESSLFAGSMRLGVRLFGAQVLPTSFRWGYGWPYPCAGP